MVAQILKSLLKLKLLVSKQFYNRFYYYLEIEAQLFSDYIPYMTGFQYENNDYAEEYFSLFKKKRLPVMRWPDLPPEVLTESENHPVAVKLKKTLLFFLL